MTRPLSSSLKNNKTIRILLDAENRGYGIVAPIAYNIEHIIAFTRAAEAKRSPLIIQFFPWAITFSDGLLIHAGAHAAKNASVPIAIHLDHAQDEALIRHAADTLPFDSIMVDMSHHEKEDNLALTKELVAYCHERGIATEAEPGRIEGGEDGVADTSALDLGGVMTTREDVEDFVATGVDTLAPAFGNVHGKYGPKGPCLDWERLEFVRTLTKGRVRIAVHGTNDFSEELMRKCIKGGVSKVNINKSALEGYLEHRREWATKLPLTRLMEEGVELVVKAMERQMDICWSSGKA
ncbi:fructose-bisphosphate aldolase [Aspergillus sclerotialis]|uniref:Fructose-bisphosphate aldolase n=1 Tax=Aspergillus sclerotialis TaxID=2070753 RepID=A0A3A2ZAD4_9EURO|nr:fructose-bisphosphate aldolase [Aspergillus sclerotialis]